MGGFKMFETTPLSTALGVEVSGIDLQKPIIDSVADELRALFRAHRLLLFRGQNLDVDDQIRAMSVLGDVIVELPTGERFAWVSNEKASGESYVGGSDKLAWHSDYSFTPHGPLHGLSLYATVLEHSEPTRWANMVRAVETLPAELAARVRKLKVLQLLDLSKNGDSARRNRLSNRIPGAPDEQYPGSVHSIIERHPTTGDEYVTVSEFMTSHVVGWTDDGSDVLFDELAEVTYADENCYEHDWEVRDFVAWDNVALQHSRREFESSSGLRILRRVAINDVDVPTLMAGVRADAERSPALSWADAQPA
jgi:taurine dioxygenase